MIKHRLKLCPKCSRPFIESIGFNSMSNIIVHKRGKGSTCLYGLIDYCIVMREHIYIEVDASLKAKPTNPNNAITTSKPIIK